MPQTKITQFGLAIQSDAAKEAAISYLKTSGTVRRGLYRLSEAATYKLEQAYLEISKLIHFSRDEIFFVSSKREIEEHFGYRVLNGPYRDVKEIEYREEIVDISSIMHRDVLKEIRKSKILNKIYLKGETLGVPGLDIVAMDKDILHKIEPLEYGGDMVTRVSKTECIYAEIPYKFSAGTPDIASILALGAAAKTYVPHKKIDDVSEEMYQYLEFKNIPFRYFSLSNCFVLDKILPKTTKEDKRQTERIEIYVPRVDPKSILLDMSKLKEILI